MRWRCAYAFEKPRENSAIFGLRLAQWVGSRIMFVLIAFLLVLPHFAAHRTMVQEICRQLNMSQDGQRELYGSESCGNHMGGSARRY